MEVSIALMGEETLDVDEATEAGHSPDEIVRKLRDTADAMMNSEKDLAAVLQSLEVSE